jgi:hypothetical protein
MAFRRFAGRASQLRATAVLDNFEFLLFDLG